MRTTTFIVGALAALTSSTAIAGTSNVEIAIGDIFDGSFPTNVTVADQIGTELPDGVKIYWGVSIAGASTDAGPCFAQANGDCFDIVNPTLFGGGTVHNGYVTVTNTAPADIRTIAPNGVEFQAIAAFPNGKWFFGPVIHKDTGFTPCPFIYRPVCGVDLEGYDNDCIAGAQGMVESDTHGWHPVDNECVEF